MRKVRAGRLHGWALCLSLGTAACGAQELGESQSASKTGANLVLEIDARPARVVLDISGAGFEPIRLDTAPEGDGPVIIPLELRAGKGRSIQVSLFDERGAASQSGSLQFDVERDLTSQFVTTLIPSGEEAGATVRVGSRRIALQLEGELEGGSTLRADIYDPSGNLVSGDGDAHFDWTVVEGRGYYEPWDQFGYAHFYPLAPFGKDIRHQACLTQFAGGRELRYCGVVLTPAQHFSPIVDISAGWDKCALNENGELYCWGADYPVIKKIGTDQVFRSIEGGHNTCGIEANGATWCFGRTRNGSGIITSQDPLTLVGAPPFESVAVSPVEHTTICGVALDHQVWCWTGTEGGILGTGVAAGVQLIPTLLAGGRLYSSVSIADDHLCAIEDAPSKQVYCWGENRFLGFSPNFPTQPAPTALLGVDEVAADHHATCVRQGSTVQCLGRSGGFGDLLGIGTPGVDRSTPLPVSGNHAFVSLTSDGLLGVMCGIDDVGRGWCWGDSRLVGNDVLPLPINEVAGDLRFAKIAGSRGSFCGLTRNGEVHCWGTVHFPTSATTSQKPVRIHIP